MRSFVEGSLDQPLGWWFLYAAATIATEADSRHSLAIMAVAALSQSKKLIQFLLATAAPSSSGGGTRH